MEKRIERLSRDAKRGDKQAVEETEVLQKFLTALQEEKMANTVELSKEEKEYAKHFNLLTRKKFIYGLNRRSGVSNMDESHPEDFKKVLEYIASLGAGYVVIDAKTEEDLKDLEKAEKEENPFMIKPISFVEAKTKKEAVVQAINQFLISYNNENKKPICNGH